MIVTIDGPAAAGKSTVARELARNIGFRFLDTGAMYRAVALAGLRRGVNWQQPEDVAALLGDVELRVCGGSIFLDGGDVTEAVRTSEVTAATRYAADHPQVRQRLVELQREAAGDDDVVAEGRDQGTVVFPDADCKFFLTAGPEERARRRLRDLHERGEPATFDAVLAAQQRRDLEDAQRPVGTLIPAQDATVVSSDGMSVEEVVDLLESLVRRRQRQTAART